MTLTQKLLAEDTFDSLRREQESKSGTVRVEQNETLERLKDGLNKVALLKSKNLIRLEEHPDFDIRPLYDICSVITPESYSSRNVELFTVALGEPDMNKIEREAVGAYLSWLMNNSQDSSFRLNLRALGRKISYLGYNNAGKNIEIIGNTGDSCGEWMRSGKIVVQGNVRDYAGNFMDNGTLEILGNAGNELAKGMEGGTVIVRGNCGQEAGGGMHGGELHIYGEVESFGHVHERAKIFHKGVLVRQGDYKCPF